MAAMFGVPLAAMDPAMALGRGAGAPAKTAAKPTTKRQGTGEGTSEAVGTGQGTAPAAPVTQQAPAPMAPPTLGMGVPTGPMAPQGGVPRTVCRQGVCQQEWAFIDGAGAGNTPYVNQIAAGGPIDPITAGFMADFANKSQLSRSASIQSGDQLYRQQLTQTPEFQAAFAQAIQSGAATPAEAAAIAFGQTGMRDVVARNPNDLTAASESRYKRTAPQYVASGTAQPYSTPGYMDYKGAQPQGDGTVFQSFGMGNNTFGMPTSGAMAPQTALQFMQLPQMGAATDPKTQRNMLEFQASMARTAAMRQNAIDNNATRRATSNERTKSAEKRTADTNQTRKDTAKSKGASTFDPKAQKY